VKNNRWGKLKNEHQKFERDRINQTGGDPWNRFHLISIQENLGKNVVAIWLMSE